MTRSGIETKSRPTPNIISRQDKLPESWKMVRFGDVVKDVKEAEKNPLDAGLDRYIGLEHIEPDNLHIKQWGDLNEDQVSFTKRFRKGQVLFGKRRAYQRKVAVAEFDGICSSDILTFEPKGDDLLPELLPFIVQSDAFFEHALDTSSGSLSPRTRWSQLKDYKFPLPPKNEQQRITETLVSAINELTCLHDLLDSSEALLEALSIRLFGLSGRTFSKKSRRILPLGETLQYASDGPFGSKLKTSHYSSSGARVIRLQNVQSRRFEDTDKSFISLIYFEELSRYEVRPGDIIVAGLGDERHPVGRACLVPEVATPAVNKADCFCLRANTEILSQQYLFWFLNSPTSLLQVQERTQGTTRFRINVGNLKTIDVPVPSLKEQNRIVRDLESVEQGLAAICNKIECAKQVHNSLRENLLAGEFHNHVQ